MGAMATTVTASDNGEPNHGKDSKNTSASSKVLKERLTARSSAGKVNRNGAIAAGQGLLKMDRAEAIPGQIIIKYKRGRMSANAKQALAERHNMRQARHIQFADLHIYRLGEARKSKEILRELRQDASIEYAEPDYLLKIDAQPADNSFSKLWGLNNTGQTGGTVDADIDAVEAWDVSTGSSNVVVAVIDTGIDYNHPDLAANMWTNTGEVPGDGIDNDGNGYVDDVYGINAIAGSGDPMDDESHGTHCAGTIGAVGNNGTGVTGVNWNVKMMALKFLDSNGSGSTSDAIACIQYAITNGAHIMSNSWGGGGYSQALHDAIESAKNQGILFVTAAGNTGVNTDTFPHYPSSLDNENILSVAATDHNDQLASFSCYGAETVDIAAPGVNIYSTTPGNSYASMSGTSMAAPHAAGLAALLKAHQPSLSWQQIKTQIMNTADPVQSLQGKMQVAGRINALNALTNSVPPGITFTNPTNGSYVSGITAVTATASAESGIAKVDYYIDGALKATKTSAPYRYDWNTAAYGDGEHTLRAVAYDSQNRTADNTMNVVVNNTGQPAATILSPANEDVVAGAVLIEASAGHVTGIARVEFYVDDALVGQDTTSPYQVIWDSTSAANGSRVLKAKAVGTDGTSGTAQISVTTDNNLLPESERNALIALYNSTNGNGWHNNSNWKKSDGSFNSPGTESTWFGVWVENNHVVYLDLYDNNLTGALPAELGDFTYLRELPLFWNKIGGTLPEALGNLQNLEYLDLDDNEISGAIPESLGNLSRLEELWLSENALTGLVPTQFGNLTALTKVYINGNRLKGEVPAGIASLARISSGAVNLGYNALYAANEGTRSFLGTVASGWEETQTVAPISVTAAPVAADTVQISWDPIPYTTDSGLYHVFFSTNKGGPYSRCGSTTDKMSANMNVSGLSANTTYYFVVQSETLPHTNNENSVRSAYSNEVSAATVGDATVRVTSPNGGETLESDTRHTITWTTTGTVNNVSLAYSTAGSSGSFITIADNIANTGSYTWTVPGVDSPQCMVKVSHYGGTASDLSDGLFAIEAAPAVTVISPNGGEKLRQGETQNITWSYENLSGNVTVEVLAGTSVQATIGTVPVQDGSIDWNIPSNFPVASNYSIRVSQVNLSDNSDSDFSVVGNTAKKDIVDFNGDGKTDILWRYYKTGLNMVWTMNGTQKMGSNIWLKRIANTDWTIAGAGDFNGDGKTDILFRYYGSDSPGLNMVWLMDGTKKIGSNIWLPRLANLDWKIEGIGDFNGDGKADILWRYYGSNAPGLNMVWTMNGTKKVGANIWLKRLADLDWKIQGVADFNSDGQDDILWRHYGTGLNMVWTMKGTEKVGANIWLRRIADLNWEVGAVGDFNGDNKVDILWRYKANGLNMVWTLDGTKKVGANIWLKRLADLDWKIEN
jgi:subtilisin family serine protease